MVSMARAWASKEPISSSAVSKICSRNSDITHELPRQGSCRTFSWCRGCNLSQAARKPRPRSRDTGQVDAWPQSSPIQSLALLAFCSRELRHLDPYRPEEISRSALVNNNGDSTNGLIRAGLVHMCTVVSHIGKILEPVDKAAVLKEVASSPVGRANVHSERLKYLRIRGRERLGCMSKKSHNPTQRRRTPACKRSEERRVGKESR